MEANKKSNNWSKNNRKTLKKVHYIITGLNYHISPALMYLSNFFFFTTKLLFYHKTFFHHKKTYNTYDSRVVPNHSTR